MNPKAFPVLRGLLAAVATVLFAAALPCPAFCDTKAGVPLQSLQEPADRTAVSASSAPWRAYIWEAFPAERLGGAQTDILSEAYQKNEWKPLFIDSQFELNRNGKLVLDRFGSAREHAIDPKPLKLDEIARAVENLAKARAALASARLPVRDTAVDEPPPAQASSTPSAGSSGADSRERAPNSSAPDETPAANRERLQHYDQAFKAAAALDIAVSTAYIRYAREMNPFSNQDQVKALCNEIPMAAALDALEPATPNYRTLVASYARYRELAASVRQQPYSGPAKIRPGESGGHVRDLQKRLQQEGFYSGHINGVYDNETQRAIKDFQATHHLDPDGVVGQQTKDWLKVSFQEKAQMIAHAMKIVRQSPTRLQSRFVRINIPQFMLEYHKDGKIEATHRVVVGKAGGKKVKLHGKLMGENQTPMLTSSIEQVILNPRWYVSDRIRLELDSESKADPEWFTRHGYVQMASLYPWGQPRIFQRPGPKNALGRVKFEFPNVYAVYLHDTPKKHLFQRTRRDFSHGCVRVDKALQFAEILLKDDKSPYAQRIESILTGTNQTFVKLSQPVPIAIEYIPVTSNGNGHILFLGDPYGILKEEETNRKG